VAAPEQGLGVAVGLPFLQLLQQRVQRGRGVSFKLTGHGTKASRCDGCRLRVRRCTAQGNLGELEEKTRLYRRPNHLKDPGHPA